jgi:hypothetical protein
MLIVCCVCGLLLIRASLHSAENPAGGGQQAPKQEPGAPPSSQQPGKAATAATPTAKPAAGSAKSASGATENMNEGVKLLEKPPARPANWIVEHEPVAPNASAEAKALLKFLYGISGKHTLIGQHNFIGVQELSTAAAARGLGKTPALYGTDWGFSKAGDIDTIFARDLTVKELIKQHRDNGSIIAISWREVRPTASEPTTFSGSPTSVQGHLTNAEWEQLMTPDSDIHKKWCAQVDVIADYLKQLEAEHVPVLWRPVHEMNGDWFWWGGRLGERGSKLLYRMMFDRLVNHHKLTNLIWVWNCDRPVRSDRQFVDYFPGQQYVDVLALDCYDTFQQSYYDDMNALSDGKVMAVSEGGPPPLEIYKTQPKWAYYMPWATVKSPVTDSQTSPPSPDAPAMGGRGGRGGMGGLGGDPGGAIGGDLGGGIIGLSGRRGGINLAEMAKDSRMWGLEDAAYIEAIQPIRAAGGLTPLQPKPPAVETPPAGKP